MLSCTLNGATPQWEILEHLPSCYFLNDATFKWNGFAQDAVYYTEEKPSAVFYCEDLILSSHSLILIHGILAYFQCSIRVWIVVLKNIRFLINQFDVFTGTRESRSLEQDKDCRRRPETEVRHNGSAPIKDKNHNNDDCIRFYKCSIQANENHTCLFSGKIGVHPGWCWLEIV